MRRQRPQTEASQAHRLSVAELGFDRMLELSSEWYWEQDAALRFTLVRGGAFERCGLELDRFLGHALWQTAPSGGCEGNDWTRLRAAQLNQEPFFDFEVRFEDSLVRPRHLRFSGKAMLGPDGVFCGYHGVAADVTSIRRAEEVLRLEHMVARCLASAEDVADAMRAIIRAVCETEGWQCGRYFGVDDQSAVLRLVAGWNEPDPALERFVEGSRSATFASGVGLTGRVWETAAPLWVPDVSRDTRVHQRALHLEAGLHGAFSFPITVEGSVRGVLGFNSRFVREPDSRLLRAVTTISSQIGQFLKRVQLEEGMRHIRQERDRLNGTLIDEAQTGLFLVQNGLLHFANPYFAELAGKTQAELIGSEAIEIILPEDRPLVERQIHGRLRGEGGSPYDVRCLRKDGTLFHARVCGRRILYRGAPADLVTMFDITERVRLEEEVKKKNLVLLTQQESSLDAILLVDENAGILSYNRRFVEMWKIPDDVVRAGNDEPVLRAVVEQVVDPERFLARVHALYEKRSERARDEVRTRDGRVIDRFTAPVSGSDGIYYGRVWYFRDVTDAMRAEASLRRMNRALRVVSGVHQSLLRDESEDGLLETACKLLAQGGYALAWIGYAQDGDRKTVRSVALKTDIGDAPAMPQAVCTDDPASEDPTAVAARSGLVQVCNDLRADPRFIGWRASAIDRGYQSLIALPLAVDAGILGVLTIYSREIGGFDEAEADLLRGLAGDVAFGIATHRSNMERHRAVARAERLANFDALTELPNRLLFLTDVAGTIRGEMPESNGFSLLSIDVPWIEDIKSNMGFGASDTLVMTIASRLHELRGENELVARLEAGEFAVRLDPRTSGDPEAAVARAQEIRAALRVPALIGSAEVVPRCHIGIAMFPGDGKDAQALLERAQTARNSRSAQYDISFYGEQRSARAMRELGLESALRHACDNHELRLLYQPEIDLHTGEIAAVEALLRWESAQFGAVSPMEFIPIAERTDTILEIGDWVLRTACRQSVAWRRQVPRAPTIAINLSSRQIAHPGMAARIQAICLESGCDPAWLGLEVTESLMIDDAQQAVQVLRELRAIGFQISLDDFGTGFSSLSRLREMPIDIVKIDRSFVQDVTAAVEDVSMTRAIITMAHSLRLKVLAEGVETEGQLGLLITHGCDFIQGYYFSKPVPADQIEQMLRENRRLPEKFLPRSKRGRTLLLVDDEENIVSSLKRLLRRDGYQILTANSAAEGLKMLAQSPVDVIVSDQRMPGMTGVDFLQRAKELYPETVRIVLSGYTDLQSIIDAVNEGAIYKFLTKPWDDERIRGHIAEAFRQKELADENRRLSREIESANASLAVLNDRLQATLQRQKEQADLLEHSADSAREILDNVPAAIVGVDADGLIAFVNGGARELLPALPSAIGSMADQVLPEELMKFLHQRHASCASVDIDSRRYLAHGREIRIKGATRGRLVFLVPMLQAAADSPT